MATVARRKQAAQTTGRIVSREALARRSRTTPVPVRFGQGEADFLRLVQARANAQSRSLSGQLKHYARLGMIAEDNPDLPLSMIAGVLEAREELKAGLGQPYHFGVLDSDRG